MIKAKCVNERYAFSIPEIGKTYWIDEESIFIDNDGDEFAVVYADKNGYRKIGQLSTSHFKMEI